MIRRDWFLQFGVTSILVGAALFLFNRNQAGPTPLQQFPPAPSENAPMDSRSSLPEDSGGSRPQQVAPTSRVNEVQEFVIRGRTLDSEGNPVRNAWIACRVRDKDDDDLKKFSFEESDIRSDQQGTFTFRFPSSGAQRVIIKARAPGFWEAGETLEIEDVHAGEFVTIQFQPVGSIEIECRQSDGSAVSGASIILYEIVEGSPRLLRSDISDGDGRASIRPVPEGNYELECTLGGYAPVTVEPEGRRTIRVVPGETQRIQFILSGLATLEGHATTRSGPLSMSTISLVHPKIRHKTVTDSNGRYFFKNVTPTTYTIRQGDWTYFDELKTIRDQLVVPREIPAEMARRILAGRVPRPGDETRSIELKPGANHLNIQFDARPSLHIKVEDATTGAPIPGVLLHVYDKKCEIRMTTAERPLRYRYSISPLPNEFNRIANTNESGSAIIQEISCTDVVLCAGASGYPVARFERSISLTDETILTLTLRAGAAVQGRVLDETGRPVAHGMVATASADASEPPGPYATVFSLFPHAPWVRADAGGQFTFPLQRDQSCKLYAWSPNHAPSVLEIRPPANVEFRLIPYGSLRVVVLNGTSRVQGARVAPVRDLLQSAIPSDLVRVRRRTP